MPKDYFDNLLDALNEVRRAVDHLMPKAGKLREIVKQRTSVENEVGAKLDEIISKIHEVHFDTVHNVSDKINALLP